jgi:molecular chaperone DnaK
VPCPASHRSPPAAASQSHSPHSPGKVVVRTGRSSPSPSTGRSTIAAPVADETAYHVAPQRDMPHDRTKFNHAAGCPARTTAATMKGPKMLNHYQLGIDVGTTYSTAAIVVGDGSPEVVALEVSQVAVPTVVFAKGDELLFGSVALRRGVTEPAGLAREFKRRLGDPVPIVLSGSPFHADRLTALMARWVVDAVAAQRGARADQTVITHPANWTTYQLGLFRNALSDVGLATAALESEPAAAARDFAAVAALHDGEVVLVYDLGGGTFDVALLRRDGEGFEHVSPFGIERLGGIDFDEAIFRKVLEAIPPAHVAEAGETIVGAAALGQLRRA